MCLAEGCLNKQLPWSFTRPDKLTSHIKAKHNRDTIFTACPISGCTFGQCTLETLGIHTGRAHGISHEGRAVTNASTCKIRKCPLWRCGKYVKARELLDHIAKHDGDDLLAAISDLETEGLNVVPTFGTADFDHALSGICITVPCPICKATIGSVDDFITHLWASHLFLAGSAGVAHFTAWRTEWSKNVCRTREFQSPLHLRADVSVILPWASLEGFPHYKWHVNGLNCPSCLREFGTVWSDVHGPSEEQRVAQHAVSSHHLSLLRPEAEVVAELHPHRMQILRLYPELMSHPVFADFD